MLTPFRENGEVDFSGLQEITEFYLACGATGLFANCLSSEMFHLDPSERLAIIEEVVRVYGIFINLRNFGIDQNYIQRYMASKTDRDAARSAFFGGCIYIPVSFVFLFIGTMVIFLGGFAIAWLIPKGNDR